MGCGGSDNATKEEKVVVEDVPPDDESASATASSRQKSATPAGRPPSPETANCEEVDGERKRQCALLADLHLSEALKDEIITMFNRYDIDGSKTINNLQELTQLTTNLIVKLDLDIPISVINQQITAAAESFGDGDFQGFDEKSFTEWFISPVHFPQMKDAKVWEKTDVEAETEQGAVAPFIVGNYTGKLWSEGNRENVFTTTFGVGEKAMTDTGFTVEVQSVEWPSSGASAPFDWDAEEYKGKPVCLTARQGADNVGYYRSEAWVQKDGSIQYTRGYDIDFDESAKEPKLVLQGKVSRDGKKLEGTWKDENDPEGKLLDITKIRKDLMGLDSHKGGFCLVHESDL